MCLPLAYINNCQSEFLLPDIISISYTLKAYKIKQKIKKIKNKEFKK